MLTKTRKLSRARFAAGLVGVSALSLAALGLTASGSQAAERLKSNVEAATGLSLQDAPPPPAAPAAAPEVQAVPEPAPAPHVERHVYRVEDGKPGKHERHVVVVRNGERFEMPDMPDVAEIEAMVPDIQSRKCKDSGDGPGMVVHDGKGEHGKQRIIICVDRVEAMAARGAEMGERYRHLGMRSALMGLRMARRSIEAEKDMTDAERSEALKGIDDAIRQVEKQTDGKDDDAS